MSFDDVARRIQSRATQGMLPTSEPPALMRPAPTAEALERQMIEAERRGARARDMTIGGVLFGIGLLITMVTYDSASRSGGTYVVAYGPMIVGAIRFFRGFMT